MTSTNDLDLLGEFTRDQSQDAFTALVQRHLNLVYCAALRQVRSPQLAEEVAQSVFTDLARQAARLKPDTILTAWLYEVTRRTAIDVVRGEARRQLREQIAVELNAMNANADDWTQIEPLLDDAMHALDATDRTAILLRFFENKSLREVGQTLGTTDDTARKRVNRAIEHLREFFAKRGVTVGTSGIVVVISGQAVQAAPVGLVLTISTAATLGGTTLVATATATATKAIAMTLTQKVLIAATLVAAVGTGIYEARDASILRGQVETLQQQLTRNREEATRQLAASVASPGEAEQARTDNSELLRLRGEVGRLRGAEQKLAALTAISRQPTNDKLEALARVWAIQGNQLKDRISKTPNESIPELQFLDDREWLSAGEHVGTGTDERYQSAFSRLREAAKKAFVIKLGPALRQYAQANDGQIPSNLMELKPYFPAPFDESILQRYELTRTGKLSEAPGRELILEKSPVNPEFDTLFKIGPQGFLYEGTGLNKGMGGSGSFRTNGF